MTFPSTLYEKDLYPEIEEACATPFGRDCLEQAAARLRRGEIDRRRFIRAAALLGALPLASGRAAAAAKRLVLVNWGGISIPAYTKALGTPYESASGVQVLMDGSGPLPAKVRAMEQSGSVEWDLLDFDASKALVLDSEGLLTPIDYGIVDRQKVYPGWAYHAGIAFYVYSCVLCYDSSKFAQAPKDWKDFWDLKKFPGQRALRKTPEGGLEAAMMAAGRSIKEVYPIDLDLAVAKVKEIKSNLITWSSGAQSQDLIRNGEVGMVNLWHTRAASLDRETAGKLTWTWNQGLINVDVWAVPKNNPAGAEAAMRFIAFAQDPHRQIDLLADLGNGPVNPAAAELVPEALKRFDPSQPEHRAIQAELDPNWWNAPSGKGNLKNDALAREMWLDAVSS